jgi:hypothetical protein
MRVKGPLVLRPKLERLCCSELDCDHGPPFLLAPPCHDGSVFVEYHGGGEVVVVCGECIEPFMTLQVAG